MKIKKIKIGIIGCGTIGSEIAQAIETTFKEEAELIAISDIAKEKTEQIAKKLKAKPEQLSIEELIDRSELVIEAASAAVSGDIAKKALSAKKDVMIMSVGGIIKNYTALFDLAGKSGCRIYLPSGALCGLDGVKAAALGKIDKAELTTRKPPIAFTGAPFVEKSRISLDGLKTETLLFEGSALEAIEAFPANINVSCALSIAGIGPEKTRVRIIASPASKANIHEVSVEGDFGKFYTRVENVPSRANPKTSYLAILSAIATLRQILEPVKIGT